MNQSRGRAVPALGSPRLRVHGRRALGTAVGLAASRALPPLPDDRHPVAAFGRLMTEVERRWWRDSRWAGAAHAALGTAVGALAGRAVGGTHTAVAVSAAGRQLRDVAAGVAAQLRVGDLDAARATLPALVGRDPTALDAAGVAAATIESVAENTVDAVVAPAWWALVAGGPGAGAHRAVNTMDAMVGRRDVRHGRYGWASARLDDVMALVPARLFALSLVAVADRHRRRRVLETVRRDASAHPSPNAGVAEAAMAGALGCRLGGPIRYAGVAEDRPVLGEGPRPGPDDVDAAVVLAASTETLLLATSAAAGLAALAVDAAHRRRRP